MLDDLFHTCPLQKMLRELALGFIWMMISCPKRHSLKFCLKRKRCSTSLIMREMQIQMQNHNETSAHTY